MFTPSEKAILGISQLENPTDMAAKILRRILDAFPWMLDVADCKFDDAVAKELLICHAVVLQADERAKRAIEIYKTKIQTEAGRPAQDGQVIK